jgi:signal transduction histidine kinase
MKSFRQKVFISYIIVLVLFLVLMFPFVTNSVQQIVFRSMSDCADRIVEELIVAKTPEELVLILRDQKRHVFYRVGILDDQRRLLYDSHTKRLIGSPFFPLQFVTHPEIEDALQYGSGYSEEYSHLLGQTLVYMAKRFDFQGQPYVLRLAFPFQYIQELKSGFTLGFLFFGSLVLVLFSAIAVMVLNHFSSPIREIIWAIRNYQEGNVSTLPTIQLKTGPKDEFTHLANTLNSLSRRVRHEIESVTKERNERGAILESLTDGVIATDSDFLVSYVNRTALSFLNRDSQIIGKPVEGVIHPTCLRLLERCCEKQELVVDELEISGKLYLNLVAVPRAFDGGALLVLHDRSVQHKMLEMRKAFIANASHELRTPITVIRGFAETVYENPYLPQETVQEVTKRIVDNCQRMTSTIKDLLTLADMENLPSFRISDWSLVEIIERCVKRVKETNKEAEISLLYDEQDPFELGVEEALIEMAIINVLENAVKYSTAPVRVEVRLLRYENKVIIEVEDHGIGIPESDLENIFQRFYRVNKAHSSKLGGSGLGLSIVETIVNKHLGEIKVRSTLGEGTVFILSLPLDLAERLQSLESPVS